VNLYISTTEPGRVGEAWYDEATLEKEYNTFVNVCKVWQSINSYQPPK
jgi:hypothetical protein